MFIYRSELGKISLDKTFEERESLNANIVHSINQASSAWGLECLRYEIRKFFQKKILIEGSIIQSTLIPFSLFFFLSLGDINPPASIKAAMDMQAESERRKRASILQSEGDRQAAINIADGQRQAAVLKAKGEVSIEHIRNL